jgi:hypothetical protein
MTKEELEKLRNEYLKNSNKVFLKFKSELDNLTEEFIYKLGQIKDR